MGRYISMCAAWLCISHLGTSIDDEKRKVESLSQSGGSLDVEFCQEESSDGGSYMPLLQPHELIKESRSIEGCSLLQLKIRDARINVARNWVNASSHRHYPQSADERNVPFILAWEPTPVLVNGEKLREARSEQMMDGRVANRYSNVLLFVVLHCAPSIVALILGFGCTLLKSERTKLIGLLLVFFGAQSFMGIYMKAMLTEIPLDSIGAMKGVPAALLITAVQQSVSFALLVIWMAASSLTSSPWRPTFVATKVGWTRLALLACCFTLNIAGNNTSLTLLPISVNLIIRACAPLTILALRFAMCWFSGEERACIQSKEAAWMTIGTICSVLVVLSKTHTNSNSETLHMVVGSVMCICSLLLASVELIIVSKANADLQDKMTPIDLVFNTALPATILLIVPSFLVRHPVAWPAYEDISISDWDIFMKCFDIQPWVLALIVLSGVFALAYNLFLYSLAQRISPEYASLCSNSNKIITICLSVLFQFEAIPAPAMPWGLVFNVGCVGTIIAFAIVSRMHQSKKQP